MRQFLNSNFLLIKTILTCIPAPPKTEQELLLTISEAETAIKTYEDKAFEKLKSVERKIAEKRIQASNGKKFLDSWRVSWRGVQMLRDVSEWPKAAEGGECEVLKEENMVRASEWLKWRRESRGRAGEVFDDGDEDEDAEDEAVDDEEGEGEKAALEVQAEAQAAEVPTVAQTPEVQVEA